MAYWLIKQEPQDYSYDDLVRDGETCWEGVTNPVAQKHLRSMKKGDHAFFYHTGNEKAVIAICTISQAPVPDANNEKLVVVHVKPKKKLANPVTLAAIKADESFANWELVRISRLSVMPVSDDHWAAILEMGK